MEYTAAQARRDSDNYIDDASEKQLDETLNRIKAEALNGKTSATTYDRLNLVVRDRLANLGYRVSDNNMAFNIYW